MSLRALRLASRAHLAKIADSFLLHHTSGSVDRFLDYASSVINDAIDCLAKSIHGLRKYSARCKCSVGDITDGTDCVVDGRQHALDDLRIAVDGCQHSVD